MTGWKFWKRRTPLLIIEDDDDDDIEDSKPQPSIEVQADRLSYEAMEGIGRSLKRAAEIRQALADGALELRIGKK